MQCNHPNDLLAAFDACDQRSSERRLRNATNPATLRQLLTDLMNTPIIIPPTEHARLLAACDASTYDRNEALRFRSAAHPLTPDNDDIYLRHITDTPRNNLPALCTRQPVDQSDLLYIATYHESPPPEHEEPTCHVLRAYLITAHGVTQLQVTTTPTPTITQQTIHFSPYTSLQIRLLDSLTQPHDLDTAV